MWFRTILKWIGIVLGGILALVAVAATIVYIDIGEDLDRTFEIVGTAVEVPESESMIEEGGRLAKLRGCNGGCHGDGSRGQVFFELPGGSQVVAPNVVRAAQEWPTEDFERVVRHGVRPDGTSVIIAMPSAMLYHLSDEDLGAIIAFLRSLDPGAEALPPSRINLPGRVMMAYYRHLAETLLAAEEIDHDAPRPSPVSRDPLERGEYLAKSVCSECHGPDLRGVPEFDMPDLVVAMSYPREDFRALMRTGEALGDREVGLMAQVAESRFSHFTDQEIDDLHAFLQTLPNQGRQ
ncbi:MAG: c-type cytochrome [Xanthomonadales bacterium]|nr:c-type cytochrome [Xanthomonadales bacterium]